MRDSCKDKDIWTARGAVLGARRAQADFFKRLWQSKAWGPEGARPGPFFMSVAGATCALRPRPARAGQGARWGCSGRPACGAGVASSAVRVRSRRSVPLAARQDRDCGTRVRTLRTGSNRTCLSPKMGPGSASSGAVGMVVIGDGARYRNRVLETETLLLETFQPGDVGHRPLLFVIDKCVDFRMALAQCGNAADERLMRNPAMRHHGSPPYLDRLRIRVRHNRGRDAFNLEKPMLYLSVIGNSYIFVFWNVESERSCSRR